MGTVGTLESLRETLKQTLDEKQRIEQKYGEDRQRVEQKLDEIKNTISTYTAELQSLGNTAQTAQPDTASEQLKRAKPDYTQLTAPAVQTLPLTADEMRQILRENFQPPAEPSNHSRQLWGFFLQYILPAIAMFIVLWLILSMMEKPKTTEQTTPPSRSFSVQFPSLFESAEACVITDRMRERVQERREVRSGTTVAAPDVSPTDVCIDGVCNAVVEESTASEQILQKRTLRRPFREFFRAIVRR